MSMGGGGGGGMPMASNRGQQMQNPQMPTSGRGVFGGNPGFMPGGVNPNAVRDPFGSQQQMNGLFGGMPMQTAQQMPTQMAQQVGGGSNPYMQQVMGLEAQRLAQQAQQMPPQGGMLGGAPIDQSQMQAMMDRLQQAQQMQGGMQPAMGAGIAALGGQMPQQGMTKQQYFDMYGAGGGPGRTMIDDSGMGGGGYPQPIPRRSLDGVGDGTGPGGMGFGPKPSLPGRGMPPAYGPTKGPIDGRKLRDMMDITQRRPMDGLPNSIDNTLPPSLKRPTQNRRG